MPTLPFDLPEPLSFAAAGSSHGADFADALFSLFILFVAAKIGEEVFRRLNQPGVIGELLGGFIVGPFALGLADVTITAEVFAELGVVILPTLADEPDWDAIEDGDPRYSLAQPPKSNGARHENG